MTLFVDYAWTHPDPAALKADGYDGVIRYLSNDSTKNLSATERDSLHTAGLSILLVWETSATRASEGFYAGVSDAHSAEAQADLLGYPKDCPIFYAVDENTTADAVAPYFKGVDVYAVHPVGVYGDLTVANGILSQHLAVEGWQTSAWSGDVVSQQVQLYQRLRRTRPTVGGGGYDEDVLLSAIHAWTPDGPVVVSQAPSPIPPVVSTPAPAPAPQRTLNVRTIDLRNASDHNLVRGPGVAPLQRLLGVTADGLGGNNTRAALGNAQHRAGLNEDFIFGPLTAEALLAGK